MKNLSIFSLKLFFFIEASLREARYSVCNSISPALSIINLEMISRELLGLSDLTRAQVICIHEPSEVFMIS